MRAGPGPDDTRSDMERASRAATALDTDAPVDVLRLSAVEQAGAVRAGAVSARELVEASLSTVARLNPELNAFVALCADRALAEAEAVRPGDPRPLAGVPVGLKDLLSATEDLPTTEGSRAFGDWTADHDTAHVRRLREAGAVVIGKTNTPELGLRPTTENARYGAHPEPLAHRPLERRLVGRQRSGGRLGNGRARGRQRPRRVDPDTGVVLRARGAQAQRGARLDRPRPRRRRCRSRLRRCAHPHRARHRGRPRRDVPATSPATAAGSASRRGRSPKRVAARPGASLFASC